MLKLLLLAGMSLVLFAGGPPSKGTPADGRLKENQARSSENSSTASEAMSDSSSGPAMVTPPTRKPLQKKQPFKPGKPIQPKGGKG